MTSWTKRIPLRQGQCQKIQVFCNLNHFLNHLESFAFFHPVLPLRCSEGLVFFFFPWRGRPHNRPGSWEAQKDMAHMLTQVLFASKITTVAISRRHPSCDLFPKVAIIQKNERGRMNIVKAASTSEFGSLAMKASGYPAEHHTRLLIGNALVFNSCFCG